MDVKNDNNQISQKIEKNNKEALKVKRLKHNLWESKGAKALFIFGIPSIILTIIFSIIEFLGGVIYYWGILIALYFAFIHAQLKKRYPLVRLNKFLSISALIGVVFFAQSFAIHAWSNQFVINLDKTQLIEPNNEVIADLEDYFYQWLETEPEVGWVYLLDYTGNSYIKYQAEHSSYVWYNVNLTETKFADMDSRAQLALINYFIQDIIMEYQYDDENPKYLSPEYKASVSEILKEGYATNWQNKSHDDCDGSAVVTVSLLQRMGFNAFIGSGKGHWYTVVEPRSFDNFTRPLFLNTWKNIHVWYYFNQTTMRLGQPLIFTIADIWLLDGPDEQLTSVLSFLENKYWLYFLISVSISIIGTLFVCYPREHEPEIEKILKEKRENRKKRIKEYSKISQKWNPIYWVLRITYIQVGNPFSRIYKKFWIDVIWLTIGLYLALLGIFALQDSYILPIFSLSAVAVLVFLLDKQVIQRLIDYIKHMTKQRKEQR